MSVAHGGGHGESHGHSPSGSSGWISYMPKKILSVMSGVFSGIKNIFAMPFGGGGGGGGGGQH
ncbi:hypothetical protein KBD33_04555 [Candidatus Gracilibacteria bacterium]|nr:hypothetical protein [Candidatus Gracilibacteria bacterium]